MRIPDAVRARDLVGYGRRPPAFEWPEGARVVVIPDTAGSDPVRIVCTMGVN